MSAFHTNSSLAIQYLSVRKRQTIIAIFGIALGVATFIILVNFMTGVNDFLDRAVFEGSPDISITSKPIPKNHGINSDIDLSINALPNRAQLKSELLQNKNVVSISEQIITPAIFISNHIQLPATINGIHIEQEQKFYDIKNRIISGAGFKSFNKPNTIILGKSLADKLMVSDGDSLRIILPNGNEKILEITGIFSFGITTVDNVRTYVPANTIEELLEEEQLATHLFLKLKNRHNITVKDELTKEYNHLEVEDWKNSNKTIVAGNKVRDVLTWSISFSLLLIAGFGIYNIMNNIVVQKKKDIAVLLTIGYKKSDILSIFGFQSITIGIIGGVLGVFLGYFLCVLISKIPLQANDFIITDTYPINFEIRYYILGFLFGLVTTIIAGYFPAKKASKVDPIIILKNL